MAKVSKGYKKSSGTDFSDYSQWNQAKSGTTDKSDFSDYSSWDKPATESPIEEPSKKKVDTGLSGTTSFLDSSFKAKGPLFDSKEELTRLGKIEGALTPEERAQKAEDARQQKIAEDKLANYKRSVIYDAVSNAAGVAGISKPFLAGIADVGAAATGLVGIVNNFTDKEIGAADYVIEALSGKKDVISGLAKEATGGKSFSQLAYEASNELSGLSGALTEKTKKEVGISDEDLAKGPIDLMLEGKLADGLKITAVEVVKAIPQVIVQSALAPEAAAGFIAQKAATFATTSAMALGQNIAQDYTQDKDISAEDALKSMAKSAIEGLTETIFRTDINAVKGIGASLVKGETSVAKELIKGVIEKEGKEAAKQEIARGFSKPLAKMLSKGFEGASVVGKFNKGGVEEGIEEVMSTVGSFIVDRVADGKWSEADYNQLLKDSGNAFALGYSSGGFINGVTAQLSMKKLTDEQKAKVEKFNEVANNENLSSEVRNIAKQKADDIIRESADLSYAGYDELTKLPVEKRVQAFSILTDINAQEASKKDIKDVDLISAIDESIKAKQAEYDSILTGKKVEVTKPIKEQPATEEQEQATDKIQTEQEAYQEELAKADASFKVTMGIPTEPMKVSPDFSLRVKPDEIGINNAYEPSPNMPLEVVAGKGKKVQFSTKQNPDALLEGDVYTVNQGNKKFATILSTQRNGVQEYYVPELDNAKGYANLDDAKFAVQEKLTGVRVDEITRSGINRLRADMLMPKADIPIVTDNGQEVLLDPVAKKSIGNAVKAFKTVSNAPVYLYKSTEDFKKGLAKELGDNTDAIERANAVGGEFFTNERGEDSIHINLANATETTVAHEIFHGTLVNVARQNPAAFAAMRDAVVKKLDDSDLLNVYDDKGKLLKLTSKEYLNRFSSQYSPAEQAEEFLSELTALLATDKAKLKDATIWESIKLAIRNLMKTAGIDIPVFEETADINDTVKFFNDLSKSLKTGQEIIPFKLKTKDDKKATKQGASVQATDTESETAKEDESLRDAVSKATKQRRKGNEVDKKKRKLSAVAAKAMAIQPTTPDDYALQYFINGGQVIRGSKDDTTEKDTVFSLFSKSRMGGNKESVSEMRARVRIMAGREAGGLSISEIAEKTFAEYQQATKGDVGADVASRYDYMDFKNAVEDAILGHKSDTAMANTLLESKNQSTEEDAAALTEEEEFEALRNKAEAQSMGMTEEEFMAKLAELQDTPEMQAAEEAYVQALDMIEDEDFAKLYELNDEDIAKIDELMAGLESTEGALDDKLAEQKKIVRDLESERKKVASAMEKAGKETQLDITGKAPIQEQLFGADTKSLTDRLQSIDTQLASAKADVAATQSAIDFQERGTVDMFEGEVETKPTKLGKEGNDLILQHGSPHNFEQFQLEKIGTGEGAQAFGYGLYFTDGSKIAKGYADKLSKDGTGTVYSVRIKDGKTSSWASWREPIDETQEQSLFNSLSKKDRAAYDKFVEDAFNNGSNKDYTGAVSDLKIGKDGFPAYERQTASGNLYLDLKDALGQQKATEVFKSAGFNGIKYEAKKGLSDSTNYVVFDPTSIEIIGKEETKPTKPTKESKEQKEIKQIEADLDFYTRQLEDSTEEVRNTNSNYQEEVVKIKAKKAELASLRLSRDEKSERKEELDAELEEAADERDTILQQYNDSIKEAKAEIKKLNKRLAELQAAKPAAKFQKQGIKLAPKSVGEIYNKYPNVVLDIFISDSKKEISLDRIIVPKEDRNKGVGTDIVNDVVRYADANGYRINLTPSGDFGGSKDRLTKFYKGFGFVENKGKNKDFSTKELMYRLPLDKPATEEINAQFTATRDNTPIGFNYDTDLVARERFNIPTLKRIGEGSDRVVFDLGDGNVLKVAKTARGLSQNIYEGSYDLVEEGILPEVLETGLNYIVAEKVESAKGNKAVNELVRDLKNFTQRDFDMRTSKLQDVLEANDLSYVMNYDVLYGDLSAARNWGVKNGKPIHLDGGTFGGVQMIQQYQGVKNLDDNDFREVYHKSRQAKAEFGDKDKFTKFQKTGISTGSLSQKQKDSVSESFDKTNEMLANKFDIPSIAGGSKTVVAKYQAIALRHGSPYSFDRFTLNKVGAGEGQQVYGYGLYFSEDPNIATAYSKSNQGNKLKNLGILNKVPESKRKELYNMMQQSTATINDVKRWLNDNKGFFGLSIPINVREQVEKAFGERALYTVQVESQDWRSFKWLDWSKPMTSADIYLLGSTAKSVIPDMQKALNRLISQQKGRSSANFQNDYAEGVKLVNMAEAIGDAARSGRFSNMTGKEFYETIQKSLGSQKNTSELLYAFGYDGVRVPTFFMLSGGKDTGKSNYVVFNDRNIKIVSKQVSKFQKTGISTAPVYKYQMNEMFKDPERLITDIKSKYDLRTTLRERGKIEGSLVEVERKLADNMVIGALSRMAKPVFKGIGALENTPLYKSGKGEDVRTKDLLMQGPKFVGAKLRKATLEAIQGGNKYSAQAGRAASSLIGNLAKTEKLQEARKKKEGLVKDQNNEIAMLSKSLNGMIGFSQQSLMRVHSLLDPEAFLEEEGAAQSPKDLDLQELRLYNVLRDMNDFIHEWHFQNEFIDAPTYEKHKGKYFARMYEEIERKEFADLHDAIDKMPSGADFRMFKERKDFSEIELTLLNDPIYITSRRFATMIHNKAIIEFSDAIANDSAYKTYKKLEDVPEENRAGFKLLDSAGGGKRYGQLTNKYVPITLYEELRGTTFANKYISMAYDMFRGYDGTPVRQYLKKSLTVYQPATRLGNITSNFAFGWLAGVDPFTMIKNRTKAKDSLDNYDVWAKDLAAAGILGTDIISADLAQRKKDAEKGKANFMDRVFLDKYAKGEQALVDKLTKLGASKEKIEKAKQARDKVVAKAIEGDKYLVESYGRTDDISKIALYRSLVDDYGKSKDEAVKIVAESMQNYTTVGKAYQFFSKMPLLGNPFVKFSSDLARIISNGLVNRPLYTASFLGMLYGMHRILSALSGEPEEEREARVSRAFIPKIPLGFTDIPLVWKVGKYEINVAKFISPYYVYDAGYRSNTLAELSKFAPLQLSYEDKVGIISDYLPTFSDPTTAPLAQLMLDKDFKSMAIADTFDSIYTRQTVTEDEAAINRLNYFGKSYFSPIWGMTANLIAAAKGEPDMYGRRRDIGGSVLNNFIKVQEFESKDVQRVVVNQIKYIDSEYKQVKTDITSRRNNDSDAILEVMQSDLSEERKKEKVSKINEDYRVYVGEMIEKMQILTEKRADPWNKLYNMRHPKKND